MAGTISMPGLGSGMDVGGIVDALVNAESIQKIQFQNRLTLTNAASTSISDLSSLMAKLKTASDALATPEKAQGFSVTSSDTAISASVTTATSAGRYTVNVTNLAQEYRAYSDTFGALTTTMGGANTGDMVIKIGADEASATAKTIAIAETDSLNDVVSKINNADAGVTASTLFDGTAYRLQLRSKSSGDANKIYVSGTTLGIGDAENYKQQARNANILIDGMTITSATNTLTGAIPGVTLSLSKETTSAIDISVSADSGALKTKIQSFIDAYNSVMNKVHSVAGYGKTAASVELLAGNSTLRSLNSRMSGTLRTVIDSGNVAYSTLNSIGISSASNGTLSLDSTKLDKAVTASPDAVARLFAGTSSTDGVMDLMGSMVKTFTDGKTGLLTNQLGTFKSKVTQLNSRLDRETDRLATYRTRLERQFTNMDASVSQSQATMSYLSSLNGS